MSYRLVLACVGLVLVGAVLVVAFVLGIRLLTLETVEPPSRTKQPYHRIRRGDSLSVIATKTGVPLEELRRLNPKVDPLALVPGQRLRLRASAPPPSSASRTRGRRRGPRRRYYFVKPGDALSGIADRTGVPLSRLIQLNRGIRPNKVVPGQRITLRRARPQPAAPPPDPSPFG